MEARADEFPMSFEERAHFWRSSQGFRVLVANFAEHRLQAKFAERLFHGLGEAGASTPVVHQPTRTTANTHENLLDRTCLFAGVFEQ
jgi:hypothetical protein